jgi:serine-type D-Ala-D-Ala carboxypeptidase
MEPQPTASAAIPLQTRARFSAACRVLEQAIQDHAFPGCAFGVVAGGEVILQDALGRFTYEPDSPPVSPATVFDVASLTKVVSTTAAAMLLYQCGRLDVDLPLASLLPAFVAHRAKNDPAHRVTLRHLLAHNSGLPGYVEFFRTASTPDALFASCLQLPLQAEPGARAEYSDPGFILLGKALEVLIAQNPSAEHPAADSLAGFAARAIFAPLGLASTLFCPPPTARPAIPPTEIDQSFRHRTLQGEVQDENAFVLGGAAGHAGLFSSLPDLLRFAAEILSAIAPQHPAAKSPACIFRSQTIDFFSQRQSPPGSSRALGWDTPSENSSSGHHFSPHSIGHLGFSGCSLWIDLDAAIAVVLLTNRTWPRRESQLIRQVRPAFHNAVRRALES